MHPGRLFRSLLLVGSLATLTWAETVPWQETFAMPLAGADRTMAVYGGGSWLLLRFADIQDGTLLAGSKDVVIEAKFERDRQAGDRQLVRLPMHPAWRVEGAVELWSNHLDGENVWMFGHLESNPGSGTSLVVKHVEPSISDAQIIANRLSGIAADDWTGRLAAAAWVRDQHTVQPNQEFWFNQADQMLSRIIDDAAAKAGTTKDFALLNQAITWTVDQLKDPVRAGRLASAPWIAAAGGAPVDDLYRRLRKLNLEAYKGQWLPRPAALTLEFDDRFAAIGWRDAEAFYRLGRWTDVNAEFLPRAKDRAWRCYQAGYRADPNHAGIMNELGLKSGVGGAVVQDQATADWVHANSGALVPAPQGWRKGERLEGEITWVDPKSDTAYIAASVVTFPANGDLSPLWEGIVGTLQGRSEYADLGQDNLAFNQGTARRLRFRFKEGKYVRLGEVVLAANTNAGVAVRLDAAYAEEEQERVRSAVTTTFDRLVIPDVAPSAKPSP